MIRTAMILAAAPKKPSTLLTGLAGYWKLNGNGNDYLNRAPAYASGAVSFEENALYCGNASARMLVDGADALAFCRPTAQYTATAWVKHKTTPVGNTRIFSDYNQNGMNTRWILGYVNGASLSAVQFAPNVGDAVPLIRASHEIAVWFHMGMTWDGSLIWTYYNGVRAYAYSWSPLAVVPNTDPISMGSQYNSGNVSDCLLKRCGIWNRALTEAEMLEEYTTSPF